MQIINDSILEKIKSEFPKPCLECFGQVSYDDRCIYYWAAKEYYSGEGIIIDAGALVGSTSMCLGYGIKDNKREFRTDAPLIHVYDKFNDDVDGYSANAIRSFYNEQKTCDMIYDFEHHYRENTKSIADLLSIHKGDLTGIGYISDRPLEILSIDVAKTPALMHYIASEFYPKLIPGHSLVLHQDYLFPYQPWLHVAQYMLEEYFERIYDSPTVCTSVFRLIKPITKKEVLSILGSAPTDYYKVNNFKYIQKSCDESRQPFGALSVKAGQVYFFYEQGEIARARGLAKELFDESDWKFISLYRSKVGDVLQRLFFDILGLDALEMFHSKPMDKLAAPSFTPLQNARREKIIPYIYRELKGLEVGPAMHPTLAKNEFSIAFLDYVNREAQRKHCATDDDFQRVPETDIFVTSDRYTEFVSERYDYIIANHVIEHVSDVIDWLRELEALLVDDGILFLTVPDKNFSFDKYRQITPFHHLVSDYFHGSGYSDKEHILDIYINYDMTYVGKEFHPVVKMDADFLKKEFSREAFIGLHRHVFTGGTFLGKILKPILVAGFVNMSIEKFYPTGDYGEFYAVLRKNTKKTNLLDDEYLHISHSCEEEKYSEAEIEGLQRHIAELTQSKSWRITAPLRKAAAVFRKMKGKRRVSDDQLQRNS